MYHSVESDRVERIFLNINIIFLHLTLKFFKSLIAVYAFWNFCLNLREILQRLPNRISVNAIRILTPCIYCKKLTHHWIHILFRFMNAIFRLKIFWVLIAYWLCEWYVIMLIVGKICCVLNKNVNKQWSFCFHYYILWYESHLQTIILI